MKKIDFQEPTHQLNELMYKVKLQDVFSADESKGLFKKISYTKNYKAVVNEHTGGILSVVGKNYKLITNKEALQMGKNIFERLYPTVKGNELVAYKVVAPASKASAHIDLIHQNVNFNFWEQETWLPFLRVSNSYNRTYALSFEIGFVRKLCSNGVIFNKETMKLKYIHSSTKMRDYKNDSQSIETQLKLFGGNLKQLHDYEISPNHIFPMVCQILNVKLDIANSKTAKKRVDQLYKLFDAYLSIKDNYFHQLGTNAYTAFNIATDIISHQDLYKNLNGYYMGVRSYYSRPSLWMEGFIENVIQKQGNLPDYLSGVIKGLDEISRNNGFNWHIN